jgi:electron transfer flavoprotein alpha subunit
VLAVIPVRDGVLPAGATETTAECHHRAIVIGSGAADAATELGGVVTAFQAGAYRPAAWAAALAPVLADEAIIVLPASPDGRDLAPRLAAVLDRPLFAGATQVSTTSVTIARGGGTTMSTVPTPSSCVVTLQVGVRGADPARPLELQHISSQLDLDIDGVGCSDAHVVQILPADAATIDLAEAGRIVGGGAGLGGPERFRQLAELGHVLGASVGATRVITDRGWIGHERQIGTTGVVVDPDLYVAFGISGAVQHTSGLGTPDHIISVNTDANCPMMQLADLAVVADANAVLDELLELLGQTTPVADADSGHG